MKAVTISKIAVANILNTISTNIHLRRQELSMLRLIDISEQKWNFLLTDLQRHSGQQTDAGSGKKILSMR